MKFLAIFLISLFSFPFLGFSQESPEPDLVLSWQSDNYFPSSYEGKVLGSKGALVQAALQIIDSGQIESLSAYEVRWYLDGKLIRSGFGLDSIEFSLDPNLLKDYVLKAIVHRYQNGSDLEESSLIASRAPEILIHSTEDLRADMPMEFEALLYNFSSEINDLLFTWTINREEISGGGEEGRILSITPTDFVSGSRINIALDVQSQIDALDRGSVSQTFILK